MQLLACSIENFGKLHQFHADFHEGLNIYCEDNGYGKSTLLAFIRVMFYGLRGERRNELAENDRRRYRPWQGGTFGGSLTFEAKGRRYRIERTFGERKAQDTFRIFNADTGMACMDYFENVGEMLFEIDADSFRRTVFIGQQAVSAEATSGIHAKIGAVQDDAGDMNRYEAADLLLKDELNRLSPDRKTGEICRLREDMELRRAEISRLPALEKQVHLQSEELKTALLRRTGIKNRLAAVQQELTALGQDARDAAAAGGESSIAGQAAAAGESSIAGQTAAAGAAALAGTDRTVRHARKASRPWVLLSGFLIIAAGLLVLTMSVFRMAGEILIAAGLVLALSGFLLAARKQQALLKDRLELAGTLSQYTDLLNEANDVIRTAENRLQESKRQVRELQEQADAYEAAFGRLQELRKRNEILSLTRDYLRRAKENFAGKYLNALRTSFAKYYRELSGCTEEEIPYELDADFRIHLRESGTDHESASLSAGGQDLAGLCRRMAFADAMYPAEKPFLLLDDPFVNLDTEKTKLALAFLSRAAGEYQILYFTCHKEMTGGQQDVLDYSKKYNYNES